MKDNKVIFITGTYSGFGWLAAKTCAGLGYKVYATMRNTKGENTNKAKMLIQEKYITNNS